MATDDRLDLRISSDLKDRLKAAAAADGRSLSNFCVRVLEQALSDSPTGGDARTVPYSTPHTVRSGKPYTPPRPKGGKR